MKNLNSRRLVLTGYADFWPKSEAEEKNSVYLGPWCFSRNDFRKFYEQSDFELLSSPYDDWKDVQKHWSYISDLHDRLIKSLSTFLNEFCGLNESEKFWKIRTSYWLVHWLCCYYDRYLNLKKINLGNLKVDLIRPLGDFRPLSCESAIEKLKDHEYNLILYSELARKLNLPELEQEEISFSVTEAATRKITLKERVHYFLHYQLFFLFFGIIFGECKGLSWKDKLKLSLPSFSLVRFFSTFSFSFLKKPIHPNNSLTLNSFSPHNEFEVCVRENILNHIPSHIFTNKSSFGRTGVWVGFDVHNSRLADLISRHTGNNGKWFSVQHGGGYDQYLIFPHEKMEFESSDGFVSWGWKNSKLDKIISLPSPYLTKLNLLKEEYLDIEKKDILYVSTEHFAYYIRYHSTLRPESQLEYLKSQADFILKLPEDLRENLVFRASILFGWNSLEFFKNYAYLPKISSAGTLTDLMLRSKIVVVDHLATSYIECLAANVPLLLYFSEEHFGCSDKFKQYLRILQSVGIYHNHYLSAVNFLKEKYSKIDVWWNSEEVQSARIHFLNEYGKMDKNWFSDWSEVFSSRSLSK